VNWETVLTSAGVAAIVTAAMNLIGGHLQHKRQLDILSLEHNRQLELVRLDDARKLRDKRAERLRSHLRIVIEGAGRLSASCRAVGTQEEVDSVAARLNEYREALNAESAAIVLDASTLELYKSLGELTGLGKAVLVLRVGGADLDATEVQEKLKAVDAAVAELGSRSRKLLEGIETPI
jgi:hypothetical protein